MTRYGIVADPHGNDEALRSCLARLRAESVDRVVCLGDIVGFNAGPNLCVGLLRSAGAECIAGNHELIALGELDFGRCADKAIHSLKQTRRDLSPRSRSFLSRLPRRLLLEHRVLAIHGGLDDVQQYLRSPSDVQGTAASLAISFPEVRLLFFAHTHEPRLFEIEEGRVTRRDALEEQRLCREKVTLINPGSVDASRKRVPEDARQRTAELAVFDSSAWSIRFLRVPYDHQASEAHAERCGYRLSPAAAGAYAVRRRLLELGRSVRRRVAAGREPPSSC